MKRFTLMLALTGGLLTAAAAATAPEWMYVTPRKTDTYYYRVAQSVAATQEEALKKAFAMAIYESAFAVGVAVDMQTLEKMSADSAFVSLSKFVSIPINLVCRFVEELAPRGYRAYVLCQVATDPKVKPAYKTFNCLFSKEE
ncbi:MAG: hypothetical protein LBH84_02380 [Prevotellaceae bacterium]|jgi:hypothetical protein|nr:hypothetical protein [Prevotellaceae bacterium]